MKISVITSTFNSEETIRDTIKSVLSQNYNNFEHIIIDGGSTDKTLEIIKESEPLYNGKLKYISEKDQGIYDAMNKGIKMASGDVIGLLNSDDFYASEDVLAKIASEITDVDAVYGDVHFVNPNNLTKPVRYYSSANFTPQKMKMGFMPAHPSFYCKRYVFDRVGYYDKNFRIAGDFEFLLRAIYVHHISIKYIPFDFVTMRTGGASTKGITSHKKIFLEHLNAYRKNGVRGNAFLDSLRYAYRIREMVNFKLKNH